MADFLDTLLASPASPLPISITATTTLDDIIKATIGDDSSTQSSTQTSTQPTTQPDSPTHHHGQRRTPPRTHQPVYDTSSAESRFDQALFSLLDSPPTQTRLSKNPIFRDLQTVLKSDCARDSTPDSLLNTLLSGLPSNSVIDREHRLQHRLNRLGNHYPSEVNQLSSFHKYQASVVETDRYRELHENSTLPTLRPALNSYYDQMLHQLMDRVEKSVANLEEHLPASTQHLPASTQHLPASTQHLPASTQHLPASTQHLPTSTQHLPASTQHLPASTQHQPASTQHLPASTQHLPASTQHLPASTQHLPASTQHLPASTQHLPASTQHQPASTQHQPASTQHLPTSTQHLLAPTQHQPASTQHLPTSTQHQPASKQHLLAPTQHLPASSQNLPASTQHLPASTQHLPASTQHLPASTQHLHTSTQHLPATTQHQPATTQHLPMWHLPTSTQYPPTQTHHQPMDTRDAPFKLNLRTRPSLSQRAIRLMEAWYHTHIDHPYPDQPDVEALAAGGSITEEQVRKWFANKRNRSRNIRPMSQIVKRKREIQAAKRVVIKVPCLW